MLPEQDLSDPPIQSAPKIIAQHEPIAHTERVVKNQESTPTYSVTPKIETPVAVQQATDTTQITSTGELTIELVRANWNAIRAEVKKLRRPQTEALLNSQKNLQVRDGTLYIGFDGDVLKQKMEFARKYPTNPAGDQAGVGVGNTDYL